MSTYTVLNGNDAGPDSLREGLATAGVTEIIFDPSVTIVTLNSGELVVNQSLTITGSGMGGITVTRSSGTDFRIFNVLNGVISTITGLTISNGVATTGGGISIEENSTLNLDYCTITGNTSIAEGGGINLTNNSKLNVSYCSIILNTAGTNGGAINSSSEFIVRNSIIIDNTANNGGGIYTQLFNNSNIFNTTITRNTANSTGGGIHVNGGVINIVNATIADNTANLEGGGIKRNTGNCIVGNTIISNNNSTSTNEVDVSGSFGSQGYNIIGDTTGSSGFGVIGDLLNTDPMLGPLSNYGGPTMSMSVLIGSPAIGAGNATLLPIGENEWDQRGDPYLRIINGEVDIGAFEDQIICYSGKSKILTKNTITNEIKTINVEHVISSIHEVYDVDNQYFVPVIFNIVARTTSRFMLIKAHSIAKNQPFIDFYVTGGHKLVINGVHVKARDIPQAIRVKCRPQKVYSICTSKQCSILINGLQVLTWGYDEWIQYSKQMGIAWTDNQQMIYKNNHPKTN